MHRRSFHTSYKSWRLSAIACYLGHVRQAFRNPTPGTFERLLAQRCSFVSIPHHIPPPPFPDSLHQGTIVWHENHMAQAQQQAEQLMLAATGGRGGGWGRVCCSALSVFLKLRLPGRGRLSEILEPGPSRSRFGSSRDLRDVSLSLAFCFRFRGYPSTQKSREPCLTDRGVNRTGSRRNAKP